MDPRDNHPDAGMPHTQSNCRQTFSNICNPTFFKSVLNIREIVQPFTRQKAIWWGATAATFGGCIALEVTMGAFSTAANYNNIGVMVALYAIDPIIQTINIVTAKYPSSLANDYAITQQQTPPEPTNDTGFIVLDFDDKNPEVAVVIPSHLGANKIEVTIRSCLQHVTPKQIYIVDNGHSDQPLDITREIIQSISHDIHYIWGHIGNKTFGQYIGTLVAENYKYIFTMDDDMRLPLHFSFGTDLLDDEVKAVCYPILAVHPKAGASNIITRWQSLEYKLSDCAKLSQNRFGGVLYPHGAASMWDRDIFLQCLRMHDAIFYAEDVKLGIILGKLGYRMAIAGGACLDTEAPTSLFGSFPNLYQQRVRSWEMGRQVYFHRFLLQLFTVKPPTSSPIDFTLFKLAEAYVVYTNIVDWFRLPLFMIMLTNSDYWIRMAAITAAGTLPVLAWNYIKLPLNHRHDLKSGILDILTYPAFKIIESAMSIGGIARLLSVYGPNHRHNPNVLEHEQSILTSRSELIRDINQNEHDVTDPPLTYKKIMHGRFFQPAIEIEDIEREFDDHTYEVYLDSVIEAYNDGVIVLEEPIKPLHSDLMAQQFAESSVYCSDIPMRKAL